MVAYNMLVSNKRYHGRLFSGVYFSGKFVCRSHIDECIFEDCEFKNVVLNNVKLRCIFVNCKGSIWLEGCEGYVLSDGGIFIEGSPNVKVKEYEKPIKNQTDRDGQSAPGQL